MAIDLNKVRELRERTNSGFLDCKNALEENNNDIEASIKWLQEKGIIKAAKKSSRIAAEGVTRSFISGNTAVLFELNSETDFVAKNALFQEFADKVQEKLVASSFSSIEEINALKIGDLTIEEHCADLTAKIGEKIALRRVEKYVASEDEVVAGYTHANNRIAVILKAKGSNAEALRQLAMHVAALNPAHLFETCLSAEELKEIHETIDASPALANKPDKIKESIKSGMLRKEFNERGVLLYQNFVMDESITVAKFLENSHLELLDAKRYELGEGIEKKTVDFAAEVAEQMNQK
ncbi:Elongation factor Ts [Metamycoplasma cloacale]|uniref:Elongation factor Ts n=1 Tax=Metamycoplasma cloacale TaxID=92401 RepID=A0A2Z4LMJ8_9BACT|nr:translation elongation factor Ts [Metamycoplasma cloacale]AWX42966.1 elongation factor Ts [Metamycoplasma cloacale]VEU79210.1 Elongation factor Ts [Metamycoplasma cloacale]